MHSKTILNNNRIFYELLKEEAEDYEITFLI